MYVMPTTVMEESPTPVRKRVTNRLVGPITKALRSEKPANQTAVVINAFLRPMRSENQPPVVAPANMPKNVAEVMKTIVEIDKLQAFIIAGAANAKVFIDPSSKKKMKLRSHIIRR